MNSRLLLSILGGLSSISLLAPIALAQVTSDGTLSTTVTQTGVDYTITNGTSAGTNLFHSFGQFSIPTGGSATFDLNATPTIRTIFSRVTGGDVSNIDGLIQTINSASPVSLFLMNPNGIILGPNAQLNLGGSFFGTTASSIRFANGGEFVSTATPLPAPLLTVSVPIGLQFGANPGAIANQAFNFIVSPNQTLALIGSGLALQDSYLNTPDGQIELGSVGSNSLVTLTPIGANWRFGYAGVTTFQPILAQNSFVDASGNGGGTIQVQGSTVQLSSGSQMYVITSGGVSGGGITVQASESLSILGTNPIAGFSSALLTLVAPGSTGAGGNIVIQTPNLRVTDGAIIGALGLGDARGGDISIQANQVAISGTAVGGGSSVIATLVDTGSLGNGGDITIDAQQLTLQNGGQIIADTAGFGNAGSLTVRAATIAAIAQPTDVAITGLSSTALGSATGNGGTITVETQNLNLQGGANLLTGTFGAGNAGDITVRANNILANNANASPTNVTGLLATSFPGATGDAGNITVNTQSLTLLNGARLSASLAGTGQGGNITVTAKTIDAIGNLETFNTTSVIAAAVTNTGLGTAGNVAITTDRLNLDGAQVVSATLGRGNAGNITINATDISAMGASQNGLSPSGVFAVVGAGASGNAGTLEIATNRLQLTQGAEISSATFGFGNAGIASIRASDFIRVDGASASGNAVSNISSVVEGSAIGAGGSLNLQAGQLQVTNGGQISVSTFGRGNAGDLTAQVDSLLVRGSALDGSVASSLSATSATNFAAGSIAINANQIRVDQDAIISVTSTAAGNAGDLTLTANNVQITDRGSLQAEVKDGAAGKIAIAANSLNLDNGSISTSTLGKGDGGQINVATNAIALNDQSRIVSNTASQGNAGAIVLRSRTTSLQNSTLSSQSTGRGNGGIIDLTTSSLRLDENSLLSTAANNIGNAGDLTIRAQQTTVQNGSQITSRSTGSGDGGSINLTGDTLLLRNNASINASTTSGNGGNITLGLSRLVTLRDSSQISAEAGGTGSGGNISINALFIVGADNSDIIANAFQGRGGNIQITTQGIFGLKFRPQLTPQNDITASSQFGVNGTVQINNLGVDPSRGIVELPLDLVDPSQRVATGCNAQGSRFVATGRGGLPSNPTEQVDSDRPWSDIREVSQLPQTGKPIAHSPPATSNSAPRLVEATSLVQTETGEIELIAQPDRNTQLDNAFATCSPAKPSNN
jgi:filamentous hemagglutinin family protein